MDRFQWSIVINETISNWSIETISNWSICTDHWDFGQGGTFLKRPLNLGTNSPLLVGWSGHTKCGVRPSATCGVSKWTTKCKTKKKGQGYLSISYGVIWPYHIWGSFVRNLWGEDQQNVRPRKKVRVICPLLVGWWCSSVRDLSGEQMNNKM